MTMIAYAFLQQRRLAQAGRKKRINGPPPQPSLPAIRHAIVDLILRPPTQRCPYCKRRIRESGANKSAKVVLGRHCGRSEAIDLSAPGAMDCFVAEPVIGRAFARPVGSSQ